MSEISLIDYGLCTSFLDKDGNHIGQQYRKDFLGNFAFSSKHAMHFKMVSRRDDLISLTYLLIYLLQGYLDFLIPDTKTKTKFFKQILQAKTEQTPEILCQSKIARPLLDFVSEIHEMDFY